MNVLKQLHPFRSQLDPAKCRFRLFMRQEVRTWAGMVTAASMALTPSLASEPLFEDALDFKGLAWEQPPDTGNAEMSWEIGESSDFFGGTAAVVGINPAPGIEYYREGRLQTVIKGPAKVSYRWKLDGIGTCGGGVEVMSIDPVTSSGEVTDSLAIAGDWSAGVTYLPSGSFSLRWTARSFNTGDGCHPESFRAYLDRIEVLPGEYPPVVVSSPPSARAFPGHPRVLEVVAAGTPPLDYQWRSNGVAIPAANASRLVLPNLVPGEASFDCVVSNSVGSTQSSPALIKVLGTIDDPFVGFACVPSVGSYQTVTGFVRNVDRRKYVIAPFIQAWIGWWNKPTWETPTVSIQESLQYEFRMTTGGVDQTAPSIVVFVVPIDYQVPLVSGGVIPDEVYEHAIAVAQIDRPAGELGLVIRNVGVGRVALSVVKPLPGLQYALEFTRDIFASTWEAIPGSRRVYSNPGSEFEWTIPDSIDGKAFIRAVCAP